jgi:hypothetical protein
VPTDKGNYRLGRELTVDPVRETFINGARDASAQLAREPRKGFEVPSKA